MTRRPKVWEPRGETEKAEEPEWSVMWGDGLQEMQCFTRAPHAWDAWSKVPGAPAFGSCRVRRVEPT